MKPEPGEPRFAFAGEHLRAAFWPGTGGEVVVSFDFFERERRSFVAPRRSTVLGDAGRPALRIQSARCDWYLNRDLPGLTRALEVLMAGFDGSVVIGFSMGGYGAVRLARWLKPRRVVLVSPQAGATEATVPFEYRWRRERAALDPALDDLGEAPGDLSGVMLFDPLSRRDSLHAARLKALFAGLASVGLVAGGHPATRLMSEAGGWPSLAGLVQHGTPEPRSIRALHLAARRTAPGYWTGLADRAAARGRAGLAALARARAHGLAGRN